MGLKEILKALSEHIEQAKEIERLRKAIRNAIDTTTDHFVRSRLLDILTKGESER